MRPPRKGTAIAHHCHARGCKKVILPGVFMCRPHWEIVPDPLKDEIWRTYRPGQEVDKKPSREYVMAAWAAIKAVAAKESNKELKHETC